MVRMVDRNVQGRDTVAGGATAVVSPSGEPVTRTTDELLSEAVLLLRAVVIGLEELTQVDLLKEVGL